MESLEKNILKIGRIVVAVILIWFAYLGFATSGGFTTIPFIPFIDLAQPLLVVFAFQLILGVALFVPRLNLVARIVAIVYLALVIYFFFINLGLNFDPNFPMLSGRGVNSLLELLLIISAMNYLKEYF